MVLNIELDQPLFYSLLVFSRNPHISSNGNTYKEKGWYGLVNSVMIKEMWELGDGDDGGNSSPCLASVHCPPGCSHGDHTYCVGYEAGVAS